VATATVVQNDFLLTEDGDYLLFEDGGKIIIGETTIEDCPLITLQPRAINFTLKARPLAFTLSPRVTAYTLKARDAAYTLASRVISFTLKGRQ